MNEEEGFDYFAIFQFAIQRHVQIWLVFLQSGGGTPGDEAMTPRL